MKKKRIALLLGDPTSIGPELIVNLLNEISHHCTIQYTIIGDIRVFNHACKIVKNTLSFPSLHNIGKEISQDDVVFFNYLTIDTNEYTVGILNVKGGLSVIATLKYAVTLAKQGFIHGILFAPFNKQAMHSAGMSFKSELEYFKDVFNCHTIPGELNIIGDLWAMRVTSHVPLKEVSSLLTIEKIEYSIEFLYQQLLSAGRKNPKIAVSGLNPHNGENGLFGTEEQEFIKPAIQRAQQKGIQVVGPSPSDTLFLSLEKESIDAIVCMYHDQAQIGLKLRGFDKGVTLLAGLPIPIGTPAHGTAFDIAGKNIASISSIKNAFSIVKHIVERQDASI